MIGIAYRWNMQVPAVFLVIEQRLKLFVSSLLMVVTQFFQKVSGLAIRFQKPDIVAVRTVLHMDGDARLRAVIGECYVYGERQKQTEQQQVHFPMIGSPHTYTPFV